MANKYYYLVSSLPFIGLGTRAPMAREPFLAECAKWLSEGDMALLKNAESKNLEAGAGDRGFLREWKEFDAGLRGSMAEAREARRTAHEERIHGDAKDILEESTPLDMEKRFEGIRWEFLDDKERDFYFDLNWLMVYCLKLQIRERLAKFDPEEGRRIFAAASERRYG